MTHGDFTALCLAQGGTLTVIVSFFPVFHHPHPVHDFIVIITNGKPPTRLLPSLRLSSVSISPPQPAQAPSQKNHL